MGGQAYLTRLAFGRSAYEPVEVSRSGEEPDTEQDSAEYNNGYSQQYDRKGDPVNEEAAGRTAAEIAAKNEVLAAVGVVEKKNSQAIQASGKVTFSDEEWKVIQDQENRVGENARLVAECVRHASSWWLIALRKRIQAGIVNSNHPFTSILTHEWHVATRSGLSGLLRYLTIGAAPELLGQFFAIIAEHMIEKLNIKLCELPYRLRLRRPLRQRILRYLDLVNVVLLIFVQILICPLTISASLQQLRLMPSTQLSSLLPWSPLSPLRWAWLSRADAMPLGSQTLSIILSPASLWSVSNILYQSLSINYGMTPFCPESTIIGPTDHIRQPTQTTENGHGALRSAPRLFQPLLRFRNTLLQRLGWSEPARTLDTLNPTDSLYTPGNEPLSQSPTRYQNATDNISPSPKRPKRTHRRTALGTLPSHLLALNIDGLISHLLFLPLESLFLRTLVSSLAANDIVTSGGISFYAPFRGPLGTLIGRGGTDEWRNVGAYATKVGLCVGVQFFIDSVVWGCVYGWVRWTGLTRFGWGSA